MRKVWLGLIAVTGLLVAACGGNSPTDTNDDEDVMESAIVGES